MVKCKKISLIPGFEGYEICETGSVYSLHHDLPDRDILWELNQRVDRGGYLSVRLSKNGKSHTRWVHRLLAECYLPNPLNLPEVNHKDGNKLNNKLENLEWTSHSQNVQHAFDNCLIRRKTKQVIDTVTGQKYKSAKEAATMNGFPYGSLKNILNGNRTNTSQFRYVDDEG